MQAKKMSLQKKLINFWFLALKWLKKARGKMFSHGRGEIGRIGRMGKTRMETGMIKAIENLPIKQGNYSMKHAESGSARRT